MTPDQLLIAYAQGYFPMADPNGDITWYRPEPRAILLLDGFRVPKSLSRVVRGGRFEIRCNTAFESVMRKCAEPAPDRPTTWISEELIRLYVALHRAGYAHSIESWRDGRLVGGLYGVSLGGLFAGESMFSRATDASKVALVELVHRLRRARYVLLDIQFITDHFRRFGAVEIPAADYDRRLRAALRVGTDASIWQPPTE